MSEADADRKGTRSNARPRVRWVGMPEVRERYGNVSPDTIKRWVSHGVLPQPVPMGGIVLWSEAELDAADELARASAHAKLAARTEAGIRFAERARLAQQEKREKEEQATAAAHEAVQDQEPAPSSSPARKRRKSSMMS